MKSLRVLAALAAVTLATVATAAGKTYQVTGPVVEATDTTIVVMKGKDKWELARTPETKVTGELKKDAKVTIEYTMTAKSVEVQGGEKAAKKKK